MNTKVTAARLARDARDFLAFKRALGIGYVRAEFVLNAFVRYVSDRYGDCAAPLDRVVAEWAARIDGRKAVTLGNEFGVVRQLCLYRRRSDPRSFVPDHALAPVKESLFVPYILSREDILTLLNAATRHEGRNMWGAMLRALILVLYCTGMRLGEVARLRMADVDLRRAILTEQRSKGRSRILAIRDDLVDELQQYIRRRETVLSASGADDPLTLFIRRDGSALTSRAASDAIRSLLRGFGLKPPRGRSGARPYEFRHAFAVHRLTAWAVEGVDVHAKLPLLSAYLGHQNVLGTEVYLKATPQLLQLASQRFEQRARGKRRLP
ncbi:tyrosine-type recombinase/integrase [Paraburkholderia tropica]|uniref:Site-specific recombinase XerD n=1 Tax=Paraburkholderia tropica TaxID=92647 RepID=A0AAQ1GP64_9BURK|nr:tyrosine-type recombinase/integrase [Paraburkholderia tropica]RQN34163.1 integrase [Paraburkholderia tropica]SEK15194.1 Site-specific recombinase XerD [Paraburkholderia tropica]